MIYDTTQIAMTDCFQIELSGDTLIVIPLVDLREIAFPQIESGAKAVLDSLEASRAKNVVLDFHKTDTYGSTALGFFVKLLKRARSRGGQMAFCNVSEHERDILRTTKLDHSWPICASREEALASVRRANSKRVKETKQPARQRCREHSWRTPMESFTQSDLRTLLMGAAGPYVSIFLATNPGGDEQDHIRFKEQLNEAEQRLINSGVESDDAARLLKPARAILSQPDFWKDTSDGMAVFLTKEATHAFRLPLKFVNGVFVGPHFQVRPLLPWLSDDGRFYILAVSQNHVRLFEATAHTVRRFEVAKLPANKDEALRTHDRDEILTFHTHPGSMGGAMQAVFSGQGVGIDDYKNDLLRYFQKIDRALHRTLRTSRAPLVLATIDFLAAIYRQANKYPHLLDDHVKGNPDRISEKELHERAYPLVAPVFHQRIDRALAQYRQLNGTGRTTRELSALLPALHRGEIETLFIAGDRPIWGRFDPAIQQIEVHKSREPRDEDLANLAATYALSRGRTVHVVEPAAEFADVPIAGIYFVPMAKHAK